MTRQIWVHVNEKRNFQNTDFFHSYLAVFSLTMSNARSNAITFSKYLDTGYRTLFIKNPMDSYNYKVYIEPLHHLSWIFIGIFSLVMPFLLYLPFYIYSKFVNIGVEEEAVLREFTLEKCAILVLSCLTLRGWDVTPNWASSRAAFFV